jgi:cell division protease FtsH
MVTDYGMSERVGTVSFNLSGEDGDQPRFDKPYSDATARAIDEEVRHLVDEARNRARTLLRRKRSQLDEMAGALLEQEVLGPEALLRILGERPHGEYVSVDREGKTLETPVSNEADPEPDGSSAESQAAESSDETRRNGLP